MLAEKRVVVTGGAGFTGSHLNERRLEDGHEAICVNDLSAGTRPNIGIAHEPPPVDDPKRRRPDISRADEWLDGRPSPPLREGLAPTVAYFDRRLQQEPPTA